MVTDDLCTLKEASIATRRSVRMLRRLIHLGRLPAAMVGRTYWIAAADVQALIPRPTLQAVPEGKRLTPRQREREQLRAAGLVELPPKAS